MVWSLPALAATDADIDMVITLLVMVAVGPQEDELVTITFTWSLLFKEEVEKVLLLMPAFTPLTCH